MIILKPLDFQAAQDRLRAIPDVGKKAVSLSINFGLKKSKTEVSRELRQFYAIKQKDIYKAIPDSAIQWSTTATLRGLMLCESPRLPAVMFTPRPAPSTSGNADTGQKINLRRGKRISVEIRKGVRVDLASNAFYARGKGGAPNIFQRVGSARYPIRAIVTLSIARMLSSQKVMPRVSAKVRGMVTTELARQVNRFLTPKTK